MTLKVFLSLLLSVVTACSPELPVVRLLWDRNPEPEVAGYRVYRGGSPREYTSVVDVGNVIEYPIPGLAPGVTEFFAVTAYDDAGLESEFSDEVFYTPQMDVPAGLHLVWVLPAGLFRLESCDDLTEAVWQRVALIGGPFSYFIAVDSTVPQRFYRYSPQ